MTRSDLARLMVPHDATILDAMRVLEDGGQAISFVHDDQGRVLGALTDGDIRRAILAGAGVSDRCLPAIMSTGFSSVRGDIGRAEALDLMRARDIGQLPVLDADGRLVGLHTLGGLLAPRRRANPVLVLAGGLGTRLHPITHTIPKPMVTVAGRPILERIVLHLMSCGFETIYLSVNHLAHIIEEHFGDGSRFGCTIHYLRESQPLGTGGPLSLLDPVPTAPVVVLNGDLITQSDIGGMVDAHDRGGFVATIGVKPHVVDIPFGVAEVEGDRLVRLEEKPSLRRLINAGIYVFSPEAVRLVPRDVAYPITELFGECLSRACPVGAYVIDDDWIDVGRKEELRRARGEA